MSLRKINLIIIFVVAVLFFSFVFTNNISAYLHDIDMPSIVYLDNANKEISIKITNTSNNSSDYVIESYTSPFISNVYPNSFSLEKNQSRFITLNISPIENDSYSVYNSNLGFYINGDLYLKDFKIIQNNNKNCLLDIKTDINYDTNISKYILKITAENQEDFSQNLEIKKQNILDFDRKLIKINPDENKEIVYEFDTNKESLNLEYVCNQVESVREISLDSKTQENNDSYISGYFSFSSFRDIYNSLGFQIFLVIILILSALAFTTRYLRVVGNK